MQLRNGQTIFSPSDLNAFLECEHLAALELAVARGEVERPAGDNVQAELIRRKGDEHERAYLAALRADGREVVTIERGEGDWELERAARDAEQAMRDGVEVIYQAAFVDPDGWRGFADFLERQPDGTYEVVDTKLARHAKPYYVLQLCFYSEQVARLQGVEPERMHVVLGSGERESFRPAEFAPYYRRVRDRFLRAMQRGLHHTYPLPVQHCSICDFKQRCEAQWEADDHLVLVASMRRDQVPRLHQTGVTTLAELATARDEQRPATMHPATFEALRDQASLQLAHRKTGVHTTRLLVPEPLRGFALLPQPSPGDLFFDLEGDPFWEPGRGLEYLWGALGPDGYRAVWAHDRAEERRALEDFVDDVHARLREDPNLHVYHYASYETAVLKRLMSEYGTREDEIDELLRREVFVDLFKVVRQSLRHSHPRYSLKNVETFFMTREAELRAGGDSIVAYERWLETRDAEVLRELEAYNEEDCVSTRELRDWLLGLRREAEEQYAQPLPWKESRESAPVPDETAETDVVRRRLLERGETLAANLLGYHRREARPVWWAFFNRLGRTSEELTELDGEAIGGLEPAGPPIGSGDSLVYPFAFPAQQHKLSAGDQVFDPSTGFRGGTIEELDDERGTLSLRRGPSLEETPLPRALIPGGPYDTKVQQAALRRLFGGERIYPAAEALLAREAPRVRGGVPDASLPQDDLEAARDLVERLESTALVVQGPPGSGKTYLGARLTSACSRAAAASASLRPLTRRSTTCSTRSRRWRPRRRSPFAG